MQRCHACVPWERAYLKCTAGPTSTFFTLDACSPQRDVGHVATPEPSSAVRRGPEPQDTWQHRSPARQRGEVWGCKTHGSTGALLGREARSGAVGHAAACGRTPCSLSCLEACMQGYSVCRVSIVAPGPTSGEVANPHVGPTHHHPTQLFLNFTLVVGCMAALDWRVVA
jgi:hypothetical protein